MSLGDRPVLYSQAHTDDQKIAFYKDNLHDIFFSIQVHRKKQNKNIVGDPNQGPNPLVTRAAKERYIHKACFYVHPAVMKKIVENVVEARRAFLEGKKKMQAAQGQAQAPRQPELPHLGRFGPLRSLRKVQSCGSLLKGSTKPNNNNILPLVPIPSMEDWGRCDPEA